MAPLEAPAENDEQESEQTKEQKRLAIGVQDQIEGNTHSLSDDHDQPHVAYEAKTGAFGEVEPIDDNKSRRLGYNHKQDVLFGLLFDFPAVRNKEINLRKTYFEFCHVKDKNGVPVNPNHHEMYKNIMTALSRCAAVFPDNLDIPSARIAKSLKLLLSKQGHVSMTLQDKLCLLHAVYGVHIVKRDDVELDPDDVVPYRVIMPKVGVGRHPARRLEDLKWEEFDEDTWKTMYKGLVMQVAFLKLLGAPHRDLTKANIVFDGIGHLILVDLDNVFLQLAGFRPYPNKDAYGPFAQDAKRDSKEMDVRVLKSHFLGPRWGEDWVAFTKPVEKLTQNIIKAVVALTDDCKCPAPSAEFELVKQVYESYMGPATTTPSPSSSPNAATSKIRRPFPSSTAEPDPFYDPFKGRSGSVAHRFERAIDTYNAAPRAKPKHQAQAEGQ